MQHIIGIPRNQLQLKSLDDSISQDNPVCFIGAFVEHVSLKSIGFTFQTIKKGRPSFNTKIFLKIYLYGYLNVL
jgi:transposase